MAEAEQAAAKAPRVSIKAQYMRDASFENAAAQRGEARAEQKPEIQVGVNLDAKKHDDANFEVMLKITATARSEDKVMFLAEVEYAGLFTIENVPEAQLHPFLMIECPRLLFPFARRIIADMTRDGGYPPLMLDIVDFAGIYRNEIEKRRAAAPIDGAPAGNA